MDRVIAQDFTAASMTGLKVENVDALNKDLTTTFDLQASHFASATGPLLMVRPRVLGSLCAGRGPQGAQGGDRPGADDAGQRRV